MFVLNLHILRYEFLKILNKLGHEYMFYIKVAVLDKI